MIVFLFLLVFIASSHATFNCYHVCEDSYPTHTYPSSEHHWACMRGCRFYVVERMTLSHPFALVADYDSSSSQCNSSCIDAYKEDSSSLYACQIGCGQTEVYGTATTPTATAAPQPQTSFGMIFAIQPIAFFISSRNSVLGNLWSGWGSVNGVRHSWLIMSYLYEDTEPSTAAPTLMTYCQGWLEENKIVLLSGLILIILLIITLCLYCLSKPKKKELSIQADDLPLVKKPAMLGSLAAKIGSITTV